MQALLVDTAVLAIPNFAVSEDTAERLFERVVRYARLIRPDSPFTIVISDTADADLWANNLAPTVDQIREFVEAVGLSHLFNPYDLLAAYQTILTRARRAGEDFGLEACEVLGFKSVPDLLPGLSPIALHPLCQKCLATAAGLDGLDLRWTFGSAFSGVDRSLVEVNAEVVQWVGARAHQIPDTRESFTGGVVSIGDLRDMVCLEYAQRVWTYARTSAEIYLAISIYALVVRRQHDAGAKLEDLRPFSLGPVFVRSLEAQQCSNSGSYSGVTLQRCAQIVAGLGNVRIGTLGRPHQEVRDFDGALAHRVHISGGHAGLRLMFWETAFGIEFANVGPKQELIIEVGTPQGASRWPAPELFN